MTSFIHDAKSGKNTLSELLRVHGALSADSFFGCYAYATQSGFRAFELAFGDDFWLSTSSRWLFGIDYGRTDPRALRAIAERENTEVRIFDGAWVVGQEGFVPRRDFHAKVAIIEKKKPREAGLVLGSGNFSYNGLKRSVEAGSTSIAKSKSQIEEHISPVKDEFESFWKVATPLNNILSEYENKKAQFKINSDEKKPEDSKEYWRIFWIEAGYVTKNRGDEKPGNQIFFPKGFREYFGYVLKDNEEKNSIIGPVTFKTAIGNDVTNNLRLNRNSMEKISLPTPEEHGFGVYDGKVLVFEKIGNSFFMRALEAIDFELLYNDRIVGVKRMSGGRRYGAII
jgi:hypothetical protein